MFCCGMKFVGTKIGFRQNGFRKKCVVCAGSVLPCTPLFCVVTKLIMSNRRWCYTLNNYTESELEHLSAYNDCRYHVFGKETGTNGTPHLQGFIVFHNAVTLNVAKQRLGSERIHLEVTRGTSKQAAVYCKKDGDYVEIHTCPGENVGKRTDWEQYKEWLQGMDRRPTRHEVLITWPSLYARYPRACMAYADALIDPPALVSTPVRNGWQTELDNALDTPANDRDIWFVVDPDGNTGKTWMCKYLLTKHGRKCQVLSIGKRDDLAYAIDPECSIFLFDVPRTQMTYLQYSVLEKLKDMMIFSPKYESSFKTLSTVPHVVVFSNEMPDMNALSADRYKFISANGNNY